MPDRLRILYAAGPGDIVGTYRHWKSGEDDPSQVAITYSAQFYEICRTLGADGYAISYHKRQEHVVEENLIVEHRPAPFRRGPAVLFHLGQFWYGLRLAISAGWFGADIAVVADGTHWFMLGLMSLLGVKVVPSLHCVLWPMSHKPSGFVQRAIWSLNERFFRQHVFAVMSLPGELIDQAKMMLGPSTAPIIEFLPTYRRESFAEITAPPPPSPFRIFFAGRIEQIKGVFDLLEIAKGFSASGRIDIEFDLCGEGSQLDTLRRLAIEAGVQDRFRCHGHVTRAAMQKMYQQSHVVIVPSTSDIGEGFNKVVAEGVLAGRPVITSAACPALEYIRDAAVEVSPNTAPEYAKAILLLKDDPALYATKRANCQLLSQQFYDPDKAWNSALAAIAHKLKASLTA
jgi:glycogen synthase